MATYIDRNGIIDAYIGLLQASAKTELAKVPNDDINYSEKDPTQIMEQISNKEIWVAPSRDIVEPSTVAQEGHDFWVSVVVFVKGEYGVADKRTAVTIAGEIEQVILENRTLAGGLGIMRKEVNMDFETLFGKDATANFAFLWFPVDKTTIV